jgi:hypothetical protein
MQVFDGVLSFVRESAAFLARGGAKRLSTATRLSLAVAAGSLVATAERASAQSSYSFEEQQACMSDAFRLCSQVIPDIPRIKKCMEDARDQLSPACAAMFVPGRNRHLDTPGAGPAPQ